jgi:4,5-dihydroxyphthalate decarboxylase
MRLKVAFHKNPRIQPLVDGAVQLPGYEFDWHVGHAATLHLWHLTENACDIFEFSMSNLLITKDKPERAHLRWVAIPTFLMKAAMWLEFYVHQDSGIQTFADLKGKRVGIPDFQMTAGVWMRIVLRELYGITPQDIRWVNGRTPSQTHGEGVGEDLAPGIELHRLQEGESLNDLLQRGEIDAAYGDSHTAAVTEGPRVRQLPLEVGRQMFADFYAKTGMTPVNHILLMQEQLMQEHPELPMQIYNVFEQSKQMAYERARQAAGGLLLFSELDFERNAAEFGADPYPPGLAANRRVVQAVIDELVAEQLIRRRPEVDSLFAEATRGT